jgi:drug/metabolite transporter superfamily protein YnfA
MNNEIATTLQSINGTNINNNNETVIWTPRTVVLSIVLFIVAGFLEVGGGYLIWVGIRERKMPAILIPCGCCVLVAYGFVPTLQPVDSFGRIFAVYGGFFIALSYAW